MKYLFTPIFASLFICTRLFLYLYTLIANVVLCLWFLDTEHCIPYSRVKWQWDFPWTLLDREITYYARVMDIVKDKRSRRYNADNIENQSEERLREDMERLQLYAAAIKPAKLQEEAKLDSEINK
ncbi:hypothetical protein [Siphonobacter sp. SORGH_AS_0500]|uniref:hypothetical protein n=1 Tax=Siphonobacter sp. SORGH_AS_0500 TaxID=1864824 RepID=UPI00285540A1|nr:hypothetical protein [Siphonobacter sp. SORGH_AS_0500]MDR6195659.1 hypothetical protein [Siphonobacter sp. SORGH_AS_0500]